MKVFDVTSLIIILCLSISSNILAQKTKHSADRSPSPSNVEQNQSSNLPEDMWDLQFSYNLEDSLYGTSSLAGVVYFNNEFWVSQWNSDSLFRFNSNGQILERFTISGLGNTRSITWDGIYLWMGNATQTIYKVNPITRSIVSQVNVPEKARFLTYDFTANNGAGGFWLGNWATDIYQVDMSGNTLVVIPSSTHGLSGMYGAVVEHQSVGGPYLWIHWQNGFSSECEIVQLALPSGVQTGVNFDVTAMAGAPNGTSAGLFIANGIVSGEKTLGGLIQESPNTIFGLELDFIPIAYDASVLSISSNGKYTLVPDEHIALASDSFFISIRNGGQETLDSVQLNMWIEQDGLLVYEDSTLYLGMQNLQTENFVLTGFTPTSPGIYNVYAKTSLLGIVDEQPNNDELVTFFEITDSTLARDDGIFTSTAYTLNVNNFESEIAVIYDVAVMDTVTSIEVELLHPTNGLFSYAIVYELDGTNQPLNELGRGDFVDFDNNTSVYTLPLGNGIELVPGRYAFAVYQPTGSNISMGQSNNIVTPQTNFYNINGNWSSSSVATARMLRPNFATKGWDLSINTEKIRALDTAIRIAPNPSSGQFRLFINLEETKDLEIAIFNNIGQLLETRNLNNVKGQNIDFDLSNYTNGIYNIRVSDGTTMISKRLVKIN